MTNLIKITETEIQEIAKKLDDGNVTLEEFYNLFDRSEESLDEFIFSCNAKHKDEILSIKYLMNRTAFLRLHNSILKYQSSSKKIFKIDPSRINFVFDRFYYDFSRDEMTCRFLFNSFFLSDYQEALISIDDKYLLSASAIKTCSQKFDFSSSRKSKTVDKKPSKRKTIKKDKPIKKSYNPKTYLMKDENTGLTKIGKSVNPKKRERTLQSEKPTISLFAICKKNIEAELHKIYDNERYRGEWFDLSDDNILDIISKYNFKQI